MASPRPSLQPDPDETSGQKIAIAPILMPVLGLLAAGLIAFIITQPAAPVGSFTPLSGLISLKTMAAEAVPYEQSLASGKPTLIEFYADWCTTCQGMAPTLASLHEQYGSQVNFVMLDIDSPQWADQIAAYGASGVPQFTLLDVDHQEHNTWVGKVPKAIMAEAFDNVLSSRS